MMAATAAGELLPPYVVYKAAHLYDSWTKRGPVNARYNRTQSGWFDGEIFADWIKTTVIPFLEKKKGKKILIGDNLSSHLSIEIIRLCKEKDIDFVFLPANSTHLTQPLDVAFFRPMKMVWRHLLDQWKRSEDGRTQSCVPKGCFPRLLKVLIEKIDVNADKNIRAGFRKCGIVPLNANEVLARLPLQEEDKDTKRAAVNDSFLQLLKEMRYGTMHIKEPNKKRKLEVVAGKSVSGEEVEMNEDQEPVKSKRKRTVKQENESAKNNKPWKGKGSGKKTKSQTQLPRIDKEKVNDSQNNNVEIGISEETKDMKNDDNIINIDSMQDHRLPQKLIRGRTQDNSNSKKTKQRKQNKIRKSQSGTALKETLNQNTNRKTNDDNAIERTVNLNNANMIPELMDLDIETMAFLLADNIDYYQEIIVETDNESQKDQRFQNGCEDQNKKKNKKRVNIDFQENDGNDNENQKEQRVQNGCEEDQNEKENKKLEENVVKTDNEIQKEENFQNGCELDQNKKENKKLDNVDYQENIVKSDNENHKQKKVQNSCEEEQNEKENIKKYSEDRQKPIIKIISDIKLPLPLPIKKSKSKDRQKLNVKITSDIKKPLSLHTRSKSTCPKRERRLSFHKDQEEIIKILEEE